MAVCLGYTSVSEGKDRLCFLGQLYISESFRVTRSEGCRPYMGIYMAFHRECWLNEYLIFCFLCRDFVLIRSPTWSFDYPLPLDRGELSHWERDLCWYCDADFWLNCCEESSFEEEALFPAETSVLCQLSVNIL